MNKLAAWMVLHGETDETLAPKVGVSRVHISRLRRGVHAPRPALAIKLEDVTGVPAAELIMQRARAA